MKRNLKFVRDLIGETIQKRNALVEKQENATALTAEEVAQFDIYQTEITSLRDEEKRLLVLEETRSFTPNTGANGNTDFSPKDEKDFSKLSILRGLQLLANNKQLDGVEAEVDQEARKQARAQGVEMTGTFNVPSNLRGQTATGQTTTAGDQGGLIVPTEINGLLGDLWDKNFLSEVGATRFANLMGTQKFPVQITKPTIQEKTEIEAITNDEVLFSEITMTPNRRGTQIPISRQLLANSTQDIQAFILNQIRLALDKKLNQDAITALLAAIVSGNGNLLAAGTNGLAPTYDNMVLLETTVANANADNASLRHLINPKLRGKLKTTQQFASTNGVPIFKDSVINDYPAIVTNLVPSNLTKGTANGVCSAHIFGDFSYLYVGMWGGMSFTVDNITLASTDQVKIVANAYWDVEVARTAAFAGYKDFLTA